MISSPMLQSPANDNTRRAVSSVCDAPAHRCGGESNRVGR